MTNGKIWLSSPTMHDDELMFIHDAFFSNWVAPVGPNITAFEEELSAYMGIGYGVALSSGTAALHLAVKLAGVKSGDIVFCSDLTFVATANPVSYEQGTVVFIDSEPETWNMDPKALERAFAKYPSCRCVICANLYGTPAKLDEIRALCEAHQAILIEDAAESIGAIYKGQQTGTFGQYNVVSFNGNKIITTSGGGMLLSNDKEAIDKARFWSTQAREPYLWYEHQELGYNYRMSNIVAGIGRGQLKHLEEHKARKKKIYMTYQQAFADIEALSLNPYLACSEPNFWLSCLLIDPQSFVTPTKVIETLAAHDIESRPIWKPMHLQPLYAQADFIQADSKDISASIFAQGVCLPSDIKNSPEEMDKIIQLIRDLFV